MKWRYTPWDGTQDFDLKAAQSLFDQLAEFVLQTGMDISEILGRYEVDLSKLEESGYFREHRGRTVLSAKGLHRMEERALLEIFDSLKAGASGTHPTAQRGSSAETLEETKPYEFGDPVSHLDLFTTFRNALRRTGPQLPIRVEEEDFEVHESETQTTCSTVLAIDVSGSMGRYGKYLQCKKVALALQGLIRRCFPQDRLRLAVFYSVAEPMGLERLPYVMPKPVTVFDPQVYLRIARADWEQHAKRLPPHFTNVQAGLALARRWLSRDTATNRQILLITDGEPTAHWEEDTLYLIYPPSDRTARHTLSEVQACTRARITINTFMLVDDWYYTGLVNFVGEMTRLNRGRAFTATAGELGRLVLEDYVRGRRKRW